MPDSTPSRMDPRRRRRRHQSAWRGRPQARFSEIAW